MLYQLILDDISLYVSLGNLDKERATLQQVLLQIKLRFINLPLACTTDNLQDTICYAALACELQKFCDGRSFKLVEAFGYQLYQLLKEKIATTTSHQIDVFLRVTKTSQSVHLGRFSFEISD